MGDFHGDIIWISLTLAARGYFTHIQKRIASYQSIVGFPLWDDHGTYGTSLKTYGVRISIQDLCRSSLSEFIHSLFIYIYIGFLLILNLGGTASRICWKHEDGNTCRAKFCLALRHDANAFVSNNGDTQSH